MLLLIQNAAAQTNESGSGSQVAAEERPSNGSQGQQSTNVEISFAGMDDICQQMLEAQRLPGLSVVVVQNGHTLFQKGYGFADIENRIAVDPEKTIFRIGSVSKALTFLVLTRLVDDGRLKRTDNVDRFVDGIANPFGFTRPVTIDNLLMHTGGFDQIGTGRHVRDHHLSLPDRKRNRIGVKEFLEANNLRRVTDAGEMFRYDTYGVTLAERSLKT